MKTLKTDLDRFMEISTVTNNKNYRRLLRLRLEFLTILHNFCKSLKHVGHVTSDVCLLRAVWPLLVRHQDTVSAKIPGPGKAAPPTPSLTRCCTPHYNGNMTGVNIRSVSPSQTFCWQPYFLLTTIFFGWKNLEPIFSLNICFCFNGLLHTIGTMIWE